MSQELAALDELKGRLTFLQVEYIDMGVRVRPALETINRLSQLAVKGPLTMPQVDELAEEISDLRAYLGWVKGDYPEVSKDVDPVINVINWLLGTQTQH